MVGSAVVACRILSFSAEMWRAVDSPVTYEVHNKQITKSYGDGKCLGSAFLQPESGSYKSAFLYV
jgi:hypothetical protein